MSYFQCPERQNSLKGVFGASKVPKKDLKKKRVRIINKRGEVMERAGDLQWRVSTKVNGELYRQLLDLSESRGLDLGELVCYLICYGLEGLELPARSFSSASSRALLKAVN